VFMPCLGGGACNWLVTATGARAFVAVAPKVWHDLPDLIRSSDSVTSFKKNLKTYLFNQAFTS